MSPVKRSSGKGELVPEPVSGPMDIADAPESLEVKPMSKPEKRPSLAGAAVEAAGAATAAAEEAGEADGAAADEAALAAVREPGREDPTPTFIPLNMSPPASGPGGAW